MPSLIDLTNSKFGRLTVRWICGKTDSGNMVWVCSCECGKLKLISSGQLRGGKTNSCGCLNSEMTRMRSTIHGHYVNRKPTPEYRAFSGAKTRCTNPNRKDFAYWGGRGIEFRCKSFNEFMECLGPRPEGLTLDRIDNNGHYEPGNVRWATRKQQVRNSRRTFLNEDI